MTDPDRLETNPWLRVPAADYEGHMGPEVADQLSVLSELFRTVYTRTHPSTVALLGCATGNGLEHIDRSFTDRVIAVDLNPRYLEIVRERHSQALGPILELRCEPAEHWACEAGSVDLIWAALLLEYGSPRSILRRITQALRRGGLLSVVLQMRSAAPAVTPTPYVSLHQLEEIMRIVPPEGLQKMAAALGLRLCESREHLLATGKRFWVGLFEQC